MRDWVHLMFFILTIFVLLGFQILNSLQAGKSADDILSKIEQSCIKNPREGLAREGKK